MEYTEWRGAPAVGFLYGPHHNALGQVLVIGVSKYKDRIVVTFVNELRNATFDALPLSDFRHRYKYTPIG